MKIKFFIKSKKNKREGVIYINLPQHSIKITTGIVIDLSKWHNGKPKLKYKSLNNKLVTLKNKINNLPQHSFSVDNIKRIIKGRDIISSVSISNTIKEFITSKKLSYKSTLKYKLVLNHLINIFDRWKSIHTINIDDINKINNYFRNLNNKPSTINQYIAVVKSYFKYLYIYRGVEVDYSMKIKGVCNRLNSDIIALTGSELDKLYNYTSTVPTDLKTPLFYYLLGCYTGQRRGDFKQIISNYNPNKDIIKIIQKKTKTAVVIKVTNKVRMLIEYLLTQDNLKFDVKYLRQIFKLLNLDREIMRYNEFKPLCDCVYVHTSRATFITSLLSKGMPPHQVMKLSGHKSMSSFQKYINIDYSDIDFNILDAM